MGNRARKETPADVRFEVSFETGIARASSFSRSKTSSWHQGDHLRLICELVISAFVAGWTAVTGTNASDRYPNILHRGHLSAVGGFDRQEIT